MVFLWISVCLISMKAALLAWEGNKMPGQLHLLFLYWCLFFCYSSCWKLEFLLVPTPSPLLASFSSHQNYHIIPLPPFSGFLSCLLLFHCIRLKFIICIPKYVPFLLSYSVAFPPFFSRWQIQCPLLMISFFVFTKCYPEAPLFLRSYVI